MTDDPVQRIYQAIRDGELQQSDLTARRLGHFLGLTSSIIYRRWGSVDGLLSRVKQLGMAALSEAYQEVLHNGGSVADVAEVYVHFGLDHSVLYGLMFDRVYDWERIRSEGTDDLPGLQMWTAMLAVLKDCDDPAMEARMLYAGWHGAVSLARSGRANIGDLSTSDRDMAVTLARTMATRATSGR